MRTINCKKCGAEIDASLGECPICGTVYYVLPNDAAAGKSEQPDSFRNFKSFNNVDNDDIFNTRVLKKTTGDNSAEDDADDTRAFTPVTSAEDRPAFRAAPTAKRSAAPQNQNSERNRAQATVQDKKAKRGRRKLAIWAIALMALLTLILTIMSGAFNFGGNSDSNDKMDNVVGLAEETATALLENKGLKVSTAYEYNEAMLGTVIEQSIKEGKRIKRGQPIILTVSSGPKQTDEDAGVKTATAPSLKGKTYDQALYEVTAAGLLLTTAENVYSDTVPEGTVISQNPSSGTVLNKGDIVTITLSDGPKPTPTPNTFALSVLSGPGGSISPRGTIDAVEGEGLSFTITPDDGYVIKEVKVDGSNVGAVSSYTLTNIMEPHSIYAVFEPAAPTDTDNPTATP